MASVRKRGKNWQITVSVGYDNDGKRIIKTTTYNPPEGLTAKQEQKDVERYAYEFEQKCKNGYQASKITFDELMELWIEQYASLCFKTSSFGNVDNYKKRVSEAIGYMRVDKIQTNDIKNFIQSLTKKGSNHRNRNKGEADTQTEELLARSTIENYYTFVSGILAYAYEEGIISENPCKRINISRMFKIKKANGETVPKPKKKVYSSEEANDILDCIFKSDAPTQFKLFFILTAYTGCRRGELLGLEWKDFDFRNNTVHIERTSMYSHKCGIYTDTPKADESDRHLSFSPDMARLLQLYRKEQNAEKEKLGNLWHECDRLFTKDNGEPMHPNTPYTWLERFCEKNNLVFKGLHTFRHSKASLMIFGNVDIAAVSKSLGHSNVNTTLGIYTDIIDAAKQSKITSDVADKHLHLTEFALGSQNGSQTIENQTKENP